MNTGVPAFSEEKRAVLKGQVIQLRSQGLSYRKVAVKLGISCTEVWVLQKEAMKEIRATNAGLTEEFREFEINRCEERLDILADRLDVALASGDDEKINKNLELASKIQKNIISLRQLDGSTLNLTGELGTFAVKREQRAARIAELIRKAAERKAGQGGIPIPQHNPGNPGTQESIDHSA